MADRFDHLDDVNVNAKRDGDVVTWRDGKWVNEQPATAPLGQQVFADGDARDAATPDYVGQLGVQIDDKTLWVGSALTVGSWVAAALPS